MIPPLLPRDCRSPGERALFSKFKEDPGTVDWIVLHSLGVAKHPTRFEGEIDFVVMVPGEGILCLEVKAGNVTREGGIWKYGTDPFAKSSVVGPFKQASEAMHAIRQHVENNDPSLRGLLFFSAVLFTYIDFDEQSPEWHPWQFVDRSVLSRLPISICCLCILNKAHEHVGSTPSTKWYNPKRSRPTLGQVKRLVELLRGDFEYFVSPRISIEESEHEIQRFTEEQFNALDVLQENERIIYKGPAGTGKTFLAMEAARRFVFNGKRTLFVCYNRLLGKWLEKQSNRYCKPYENLLIPGNLHRFLLHISGLTPPEDNDADFWTNILPTKVLDRALEGDAKIPHFDSLVLDEAQDLLTEIYLDVFDLLLEGGLAGGQWVMFGDFERQAIFTRPQIQGKCDVPAVIKSRVPVHFTFPLRINCRNTAQIASGVELVCNLQPGYSKVLQLDQGVDVEIDFYTTKAEQRKNMCCHLERLCQAYKPSELVILSTKEDGSSCASELAPESSFVITRSLRDEDLKKNQVGFATIHAYKGLEAPVVILTDIDKLTGERAQALLYIGMSRARLRLVLLVHESCRKEWLQIVQEGFLNKSRRRGQ